MNEEMICFFRKRVFLETHNICISEQQQQVSNVNIHRPFHFCLLWWIQITRLVYSFSSKDSGVIMRPPFLQSEWVFWSYLSHGWPTFLLWFALQNITEGFCGFPLTAIPVTRTSHRFEFLGHFVPYQVYQCCLPYIADPGKYPGFHLGSMRSLPVLASLHRPPLAIQFKLNSEANLLTQSTLLTRKGLWKLYAL